MTSPFIGTWAMESQEKFEDYMAYIGVGWFLRKMGMQMKPDFKVSKSSDDTWTMETISSFRTTLVEFKEGVEFEKKTTDVERIIDGDTLLTLVKAGDIEAKRVYKK